MHDVVKSLYAIAVHLTNDNGTLVEAWRPVLSAIATHIEAGNFDLATELEAIAGTVEDRRMSPALTAAYVTGQLATQAEAEGWTNATKLLTLLTAYQEFYKFANEYATEEDLRFPATSINPPGLVDDPQWDADNLGWLFDASKTEQLQILAQISHHYLAGTNFDPHVHWTKTTSAAGNVLWRMEYKWQKIGEVLSGTWTTVDATTTIIATPDNNTAYEHLLTSFGEISGTGADISDMLVIKLSRVGGDALDTYGADARLLEFDIHFHTRMLGEDV